MTLLLSVSLAVIFVPSVGNSYIVVDVAFAGCEPILTFSVVLLLDVALDVAVKETDYRRFLSKEDYAAAVLTPTPPLQSCVLSIVFLCAVSYSNVWLSSFVYVLLKSFLTYFWYFSHYRHYRPQRSWAKVMFFTGVCDSVHGGGGEGVCLSACWDARPPRTRHSPQSRPPGSRHPPHPPPMGGRPPRSGHPPGADTPPEQSPPTPTPEKQTAAYG